MPPIQAVITFIPMSNWLGGSFGLAYALSYSTVGGGIVLSNVNMTTIDGCDSSTETERTAHAQDAFGETGQEMQQLLQQHGFDSPEGKIASRWLSLHARGNLYTLGFPDGSSGYYRIGQNWDLTEENCGTPNP